MSYEIAKGTAKFKYGMSNPAQLLDWLKENPDCIGLAFVGRSNVGKSSLINTLFGKSTARTSKTPGRTKEINIFEFGLQIKGKPVEDLPTLFLFDLPGYGFAEVSKGQSKAWDKLMTAFFENAGANVALVNLQDARHPNQKADQEFSSYISNFSFDTWLVFNKMDKLKTQKERAQLNNQKSQLFEKFKSVKHIFFVSAENGNGVKELHDSFVTRILELTSY